MLVERALTIYRERGLAELCKRSYSYASCRVLATDPIDYPCYVLSQREIDRYRDEDEDLDDVLRTTGYTELGARDAARDATSVPVPGEYTGYGIYRANRMLMQERASITGLARAVRAHSPETVVEIGSGAGGSLYVWCRVLPSMSGAVSVDFKHPGRYDRFFERFAPSNSITCITGDSHSKRTFDRVRSQLDGESVDFLYIDGDHSYDGVKRDFERYEPLLASDGIIGLHDISNQNTGVPAFWEELRSDYETREFGSHEAKNGLVVLE